MIERTADGESAIYEEVWKDLDVRFRPLYLARNKSKQAEVLRSIILDYMELVAVSSIFTSSDYDAEEIRAYVGLVSGIVTDEDYDREKVLLVNIYVFRMWIRVGLQMLYENYFDKYLSCATFESKYTVACRICCISFVENVLRSATEEFKIRPPSDQPDELREVFLNQAQLDDIGIPLGGLRAAIEKGDIQSIDECYAQFQEGVLSLPAADK